MEPRPGLRDALAQAILDAKKSAQVETNRWKERCAQAEAQAFALRHEVLDELRQPPSAGDMDVLNAVIERNGGVGDTAAFWRHVRIVQTVRERAGGSGAEAACATTAPADVIAFIADVVASAPGAEPPRHAAAFLDAAFKYLSSLPVPGSDQSQASALQDACSAMAGVIAAHGPGAARDARPCACAVLCRLAKQAHVCTAAVLVAVEERLLCSVEACAAAASAAAAAPFDEELSWDASLVHQHYENAYFLFSVAETALDVIAGRLMATSGQQGGLSPAEATATLERFARVHAKCQRCAEALCPRFAVLAAAVWRLTSAANAIALRVLQQ